MTARGVVAFPITPADADGRVDAAGLRRLVGRAADAGVDAVCVLGSTGAYPFLTRDERRRALDAAAAELDGRTPLMAGVGALRTDAATAHARDAAAAGAMLGLLAPVSYTPLTEREVVTHFEAVAGEGGLPLCVYDNPAATHFAITDVLLTRLAAVPGVVAVKSPGPPPERAAARLTELRACTLPGFSVGFSVDSTAAGTLSAGADAWYSVLAGVLPAPAVSMRRAAAAGELETLRELDARLEPLWRLMRAHGGLRVAYAVAYRLGLTDAAPPRPILPLEPEAQAEVGRALEALGPELAR